MSGLRKNRSRLTVREGELPWNKSWRRPAALPMAYLGDDVTDESAFGGVGAQAVSILVRTGGSRSQPAGSGYARRRKLLHFLDDSMAASQDQSLAPISSAEALR